MNRLGASSGAGAAGQRRLLLTALAVAVVDQVVKRVVVGALRLGSSVDVLGSFFRITRTENTGAAFGIFKSRPHLFVVVAILSVFLIVYLLSRRRNMFAFPERLALYFILGGTFGNLLDRIRLGYVVDFIDLRIWPVFNVADSFITIGAVMLCWSILARSRA